MAKVHTHTVRSTHTHTRATGPYESNGNSLNRFELRQFFKFGSEEEEEDEAYQSPEYYEMPNRSHLIDFDVDDT